MLPDEVRQLVDGYLRVADRVLPGRIEGFYVVGSTALGAYRPGRSDIDFVAVVDGELPPRELRRLRLVHVTTGARSGLRAARRGRLAFPGTCNGVFVKAQDLGRPVLDITPLASHTAARFTVGSGFDVNPVGWHVLANHGIAVRGPGPATLGLRTDDGVLRSWTLDNLGAYWEPWAHTILARRAVRLRARWRWLTAWGVLGVARMHHTVATGEVIAKEVAGDHALATFPDRWHPLIDEALAYRRDQPVRRPAHGGAARARQTAQFVLDVIGDTRTLAIQRPTGHRPGVETGRRVDFDPATMSDMGPALEVVIVQHADKRSQPGDPGLTLLGRQQAALTARWLAANLDLAAVWSSPLRRALETTTAISTQTRLPATTDDRLRERMNWDDPDAQPLGRFLDEWAAATHDRDLVPTSGDSSNDAAHRFLDNLVCRHHRGTHAIVTHGGITVDLLRTLIGDHALRARSPRLIDHGMPSCGLTRLSHDSNGWVVVTIARTGHLEALGP